MARLADLAVPDRQGTYDKVDIVAAEVQDLVERMPATAGSSSRVAKVRGPSQVAPGNCGATAFAAPIRSAICLSL